MHALSWKKNETFNYVLRFKFETLYFSIQSEVETYYLRLANEQGWKRDRRGEKCKILHGKT